MVDFSQYGPIGQAFIAWAFLTGVIFQWIMIGSILVKWRIKHASNTTED